MSDPRTYQSFSEGVKAISENVIGWPKFTSEEIISLRKRLGLTQTMLGTLLGVSRKTIGNWESGTEKIPSYAMMPLSVIATLKIDIFCLMNGTLKTLKGYEGKDSVPHPLPVQFDGQTIRNLRLSYGLNRKDFAALLGVSVYLIDRWEIDALSPKGSSLLLLKMLWVNGLDAFNL